MRRVTHAVGSNAVVRVEVAVSPGGYFFSRGICIEPERHLAQDALAASAQPGRSGMP